MNTSRAAPAIIPPKKARETAAKRINRAISMGKLLDRTGELCYIYGIVHQKPKLVKEKEWNTYYSGWG